VTHAVAPFEKVAGDAGVFERGERQIAELGLDASNVLQVVGFAARAEPEKVLTRLVAGNDGMEARSVRFAAGRMRGRVAGEKLGAARFAD
jgi:hypothetical protein